MRRIARLPGMLPAAAPLLLIPLVVAGCGGGSPDEGARLSEAAQRALADAPPTAPPDAVSAAESVAQGPEGAAEGVIEGEGPETAGPPPVAPHPTRLMILEDGLYARDAGDNWKKYENGSWVSVHAPQVPPGMQ
ncbi:hypothetical protein EM868_05815 [Cupriavidus gilardii]|uniref:hypothetical protein n=1 Tax=Cupriavidus gilardii TaxID=82541 RepID=UPI001EE5E5A6|nr:hypothetical protein [Cupriavidus gilardii]MCG5258795.1 hypothetical protein [Cupriavidus gilardii]MDF9429313.1 hypothetical protein [Cupriavidus gilardii]